MQKAHSGNMRGQAANSQSTSSIRQTNGIREKREKYQLSPDFGIFSMQVLCFEYFAKEWGKSPHRKSQKTGILSKNAKKNRCVHAAEKLASSVRPASRSGGDG